MYASEYIDTVVSAKMIRAALKKKFPGVKFSVRSDRYAGGSSIRIHWMDGPTQNAVDAVVQPYSGSGFDGMIDMKYSKASIMLADGTITYGPTSGTEGSMGVVSKREAELPEGAKIVKFAVDYIFAERSVSPEALKKGVEKVVEKYGDFFGADEVIASIKPDDYSGAGHMDYKLGERNALGEAGWDYHWTVQYKTREALQEMAF